MNLTPEIMLEDSLVRAKHNEARDKAIGYMKSLKCPFGHTEGFKIFKSPNYLEDARRGVILGKCQNPECNILLQLDKKIALDFVWNLPFDV